MGANPDLNQQGIALADAIAMLRNELLTARALGVSADIQLPVQSMTVELHVAATRSSDGKAGFRVPFVHAELGGSTESQRETVQTITVVFSEPIDRDGNPVRVAAGSDERKR